MVSKTESNFPSKLKLGLSNLFASRDFSVARIGNKERWYKSILGDEEFDGDSLYAKMKGEDYQLVDGLNINDVGIFDIYKKTFRKVNIGKDPGFMIAYSKIRELKSPHNKKFWLNLLIGNSKKNEFKKEILNYQELNESITQPISPEVFVNDTNQSLSITQKLIYPHSMSFEKSPRHDLFNREVALNKFGISLESIVLKNLNSERVKDYIGSIGPKLGYDYTYDPIFPKKRKDICAVRHMAESGSSGFDTIYFVWLDNEGEMNNMKIANSKASQNYLFIREIKEDEKDIIIKIDDWEKKINKKDLRLK